MLMLEAIKYQFQQTRKYILVQLILRHRIKEKNIDNLKVKIRIKKIVYS
jgi:hypothetical protein